MLENLDKIVSWDIVRPLVIALTTIAIRVAVATDVAERWHYTILLRRVVVAVSVTYFAADLAQNLISNPAYRTLAVVGAAFFSDDIIAVAIKLGSDFRKDGPKTIKDVIMSILKRRKK